MLSKGAGPVRAVPANTLATAEISPSLHDCTSPIKAVGAPISALHGSPDLMAQRFFEEITWEARIFSPRPKCGSQSVWSDWTAAWDRPNEAQQDGQGPSA